MNKTTVSLIIAILLIFGICGWLFGLKSVKASKNASYTTNHYTVDYDTETEAKNETETETAGTDNIDYKIEHRNCL